MSPCKAEAAEEAGRHLLLQRSHPHGTRVLAPWLTIYSRSAANSRGFKVWHTAPSPMMPYLPRSSNPDYEAVSVSVHARKHNLVINRCVHLSTLSAYV